MLNIDSHHHVWELGVAPYAWLNGEAWQAVRRNFVYDDVRDDLLACGIQNSILVQADNTKADSDYVKRAAVNEEMVLGFVGWVSLTEAEKIDAALDDLAEGGKLVGIRHLLTREADEDWILRPDVLNGLQTLERRQLAFDLNCDRPAYLAHVPQLAERLPDLRLVANHAGKPPIGSKGWEPWATNIARAAQCPNVYIKISGLTTPYREGWCGEDFRPYVEYLIEQFGPQRMMYASNWPVTLVAGSYKQQWDATRLALNSLYDDDLDWVFGGSALQCYRLD